EMVRVHEARGRGYDAVAVGVAVVSEGHLIRVLEAHESGHRIRARAVRADLAVVIDGHEGEGRVERAVHDREVEAIGLADRVPTGQAGSAERIDRDADAGRADR